MDTYAGSMHRLLLQRYELIQLSRDLERCDPFLASLVRERADAVLERLDRLRSMAN
jgi:hypothetical protein